MSDKAKGDGTTGKSPNNANKRRARTASDDESRKSGIRGRGGNWGRVLRTAYDDALREPVPDDFLDLLGKLD